jgi:integrase
VLTDTAIRKARASDKAVKLFDAGGLYLLLTPAGGKLWRFKYRYGTNPTSGRPKEKLLGFGAYPEVSLADARERRDAARRQLSAGVDPSQARREDRLARETAQVNSFEAVARGWHEYWKTARSQSHVDYVLRRLEADVFPEIGHRPLGELKAQDFVRVVKKIEARGALDIAKRALQTCGQVARYAVAHGLLERNPVADVKPGDVLKGRRKENYARVDARELPELLRKMHAYDGSPYTRFALQLIALTFVRTSELIEAHWSEIDFEKAQWRIPAERMKMKTLHVVPLSTQALDVLRCLYEIRGQSGLLFPGERDHEKPMSNNTILMALGRMGYKGRMTGHGFRGVASTVLHEHGFDHAHIELQLAHTERNQVSAAYNHALYLPQRQKMMQWWGDYLDAQRKHLGPRAPG